MLRDGLDKGDFNRGGVGRGKICALCCCEISWVGGTLLVSGEGPLSWDMLLTAATSRSLALYTAVLVSFGRVPVSAFSPGGRQ